MIAGGSPSDAVRERGRGSLVALAFIVVLGAAVRLAGWTRVFTAGGVRFVVDTDPNYHVLQAKRLLDGGMSATWFDPSLNWPFGADVPWPPLFDLVVAAAARVAYGGEPSLAQVERAAALVPVVLGCATLVLVAALGSVLLGRGRAVPAAFLVAVAMSHIAFSTVGRPDQHVAEVLLSCAIALGFAWSWTACGLRARALAAFGMGVAVALAQWNWLGSAFNLVLSIGFAAAAHVILDQHASRRIALGLATGLGSGAVLLLASIAAWGPPGALGRGGIAGLTGMHVAVTACGAASGAALVAAARVRSAPAGIARRIVEASLACVAPPVVAVVALPAVREGFRQGLTALGAANPWYAEIGEFQHLLFSCDLPLKLELGGVWIVYGLAPLAAALAAPALVARWRRSRSERSAVLFLACWGAGYLLLALVRRRFAPYVTIPIALLASEGVWFAASWAARRAFPGRRTAAAAITAAGAVAIAGVSIRGLADEAPRPSESHLAALRWLSAQRHTDGNDGVFAPWALGHLVLYYAQKPVVVSPFGTEGGVGAMEFAARMDLAPEPDEAERLLAERRVGWVVLGDPRHHAVVDQGFAPRGTPRLVTRTCSLGDGATEAFAPEYVARMAPRLYYFDGLTAPGWMGSPADGFRLVYETPPSEGEQLKIFERVPGVVATVSRAAPSRPVRASVRLRTNEGRQLVWTAAAVADSAGVARFRLPYATGANGAASAEAWQFDDGIATAHLALSDGDVTRGRDVTLELAGPPGPHPAAARTRP